jgi:hypothetical protein
MFHRNFVYVDEQPPTFMEVHSCHHKHNWYWYNKFAKSSKYYKKRNIKIKENKIVNNDYRDIHMMYSNFEDFVGDHDWNCSYFRFYKINGEIEAYKAFEYDEFLVVFRNIEAGSV